MESVALKTFSSTTYMGNTNAAKELKIAATNKYKGLNALNHDQILIQSLKKIGPNPLNPGKTPYYCGVEVRQ